MTIDLTKEEIKQRSITGVKWLIIMNFAGMPLPFLTAMLLGRMGPATLGTYSLVQILIGIIATFIIYGGSPVLSVFIPKIKDRKILGNFIFSYLLIISILMIFSLIAFRLFPGLFEFLLRSEFDMNNFRWFVWLSVIVVFSESFANIATGLMLIKINAISRQMVRLFVFVVVLTLFWWKPEILRLHGIQSISGGFVLGYILSIIICHIGILKDRRLEIKPGWFLPKGFWTLSISIMMGTVLTFIYGNFDRVVILSVKYTKEFGMYQAVLSLSSLINVIPQILGTSLIPLFASLLATKKMESVCKLYYMVQRIGSLIMVISALFLIVFSNECLSLFGSLYTSYSYLLILFCISAVITSPYFGNTPVLIATEKNMFRLAVSLGQILVQVILTLLFLKKYDILAIAGAKIIGVICAQITCIFYVTKKSKMGLKLPNSYKISVILVLIVAILKIKIISFNLFSSVLLFLISLCTVWFASGFSYNEIKTIISIFINRTAKKENAQIVK